MTDEELLELAAKAAGYTLEEHYDHDMFYPWCTETLDFWNPLIDNADAFALMVKLKIDISLYNHCVSVNDVPLEFYDNDPCSAVRRGIVNAAAVIGKEMETSDISESEAVNLGKSDAS